MVKELESRGIPNQHIMPSVYTGAIVQRVGTKAIALKHD